MAANFWESTHCKNWLLKKEQVEMSNEKDKKYLTDLELKKIRIFFVHWITCLGKNLHLRQRVVATAVVYWKRFYLHNSFDEFEPALLGGTCIYLASKVEECNIKVDSILAQMKAIGQDKKDRSESPVQFSWYQTSQIIQCEFYLIDGLHCHLLLYHPYTCLQEYLVDSGLEDCKDEAWKIINDSYRTDVYLMYPPYIITLACIYLTGLVKDKEAPESDRELRISKWFSELNVGDLTPVGEVVQEILSVYEVWGNETTFLRDVSVLLKKKLHRVGNDPSNDK